MVHAVVKVVKYGNSYGVIIPKRVVRNLGIEEGDTVEFDIVKHEKVNGFGIARGKGPITHEDIDDIHDVGD